MLDSRIVLSDPAKSGAKVDDRGKSNKIWIKSKWQPGPGSLGSGGAPNTFDGAARADGVRIGQAQGVMPVGVGANGDGGGGPAATRMPQDDASYNGTVQVGGGFKAERAAPQDAGIQPSWHDTYPDNNLAPRQFGDSELPFEDALAACGPTAAIAFLRANGRNMTLHEAVKMAQGNGTTSALWDRGGMHGPDSEVQLLQRMGVAAKIGDADPQTIAREVQNGNPVIVSSAGQFHYLVISGYDESTGAFYVGNTGTVWKDPARNKAWQTWDQIAGQGATAIYMDNPQSPTPSVAADPSVYGSNIPAGSAPAPGNNADRPNQIPGMWSPTTESLDRALGGNADRPNGLPGTPTQPGTWPEQPPSSARAMHGAQGATSENPPQQTVRQSSGYHPAPANPDAMAPGKYQAPWGTSFTDADMGTTFKWYKAQFGDQFGGDEGALKQSFLDDWTQHPDYMRNALGMAQAGEVDSLLGGQMQQNVQQQPVPAQRTRPTPVGSKASDPSDPTSYAPGITDTPWARQTLGKWNPGTGAGGDVPMQSTLGQGPDPTVSMLRDQTHTPQWGATWQPPGGDPNQHESISGKTF